MSIPLKGLNLQVDRPIEIVVEPEPSLEDVFRKHFRLVYGTALHLTGNPYDADDAVQNTFLELIRRSRPITLIKSPPAYFRRAAAHQALKILRKRQRVELTADAGLYEASQQPASFADRQEQQLLRYIASLRPAAALMMKLKYVEGFSNMEIAAMLDKSEAVVAVTLYRLRRRLKRLAKGEI